MEVLIWMIGEVVVLFVVVVEEVLGNEVFVVGVCD